MKKVNDRKTGVVLAAGLGSRLAKTWGDGRVKPLVAVDGKVLLLRTLASLELACDRVVIVLGFGADSIRSYVENRYHGPMNLVFAVNHLYQLSNGLSVLAAREYVGECFVLCMADHIMGDELLMLARDYVPPAGGAALLVDYKLKTIFDMDDATKVRAENGKILRIGKNLTDYNCIDTGLFICSKVLIEVLSEVYQKKGDASLSDGIQKLCERSTMHAIDIGDGFWQDVDTAEMLRHAERQLILRRSGHAILQRACPDREVDSGLVF